ncbi:MAG: 4Fe-4S binding protein [Thermoleophilia bacterium]
MKDNKGNPGIAADTTGAAVREKRTGLDRILYWSGYPSKLHVLSYLVLAVLVYFAFNPARQAEGNLTTEVVWKLWWPGLSFILLVGGRIWCGVCPFGGLADLAARLRQPSSSPPRLFRQAGPWLGIVSVFFFGIAFLALGLEMNAAATGGILVGMAALSFGFSLAYKGRNFCRYLCPIGMITRVYSFFSWLTVRGGGGVRPAVSCPVGQSPASLRQPSQCHLCGTCTQEPLRGIRTATGFAGIRLPARAEFGRVEATLSVVLLGLMASDTVRMTPLFARYQRNALPYFNFNYRLSVIVGVAGLTTLLLVGSLLLTRLLARRSGSGASIYRSLGFALLPLTFGVFMALALQHLWSGTWPSLQTIAAETRLLDWTGHMPPDDVYFVSIPLKLIQFTFLAVGFWFSLRLAGKTLAESSDEALAAHSAKVNDSQGAPRQPVILLPAGAISLLFLLPMSGAC